MTEHRLAVVTGASRGIGQAIAQRLMRDGHDCIVTGRSEVPARMIGAKFYALDFEDADGVTTFAAFLAQARPDILVNNAGINISGPTETFSIEDFDRLYSVNLRTPFVL